MNDELLQSPLELVEQALLARAKRSALVAERACRNLTGYGPLGPLLADDDVWEILVVLPSA